MPLESGYAGVNRSLARLIGIIISSTTIAQAFTFKLVSEWKKGRRKF